MSDPKPFLLATRGSPLALVQANLVKSLCESLFQSHFPELKVDLNIIKTTGDHLQKSAPGDSDSKLPKGLFTKELEVALLNHEADLAVHSLKDLPTDLPEGLQLSAVLEREDPRDVLVLKMPPVLPVEPNPENLPHPLSLSNLPLNAIVASNSTRRHCLLLHTRPDLQLERIRGNVGTRLRKVKDSSHLQATLLALAGIKRLGYAIAPHTHELLSPEGSTGLYALPLPLDTFPPCVGQAAIGLETRQNDPRALEICKALNHLPTWNAILAERSLLRSLGGGCQSPLAAHATLQEDTLTLQAIYFQNNQTHSHHLSAPASHAETLGKNLSLHLLQAPSKQ